ncbi:MAG TPA: ATP-binding protein [Nevskiaceae bacterium]|nr:ATP-binding protein [Nevskiaceae bacterium]
MSLTDARALVVALAWLRPCAVGGQLAAIFVAERYLKVPLPLVPVLAGVGLLATAVPLAGWRLHWIRPVGQWEAVLQVAFDVLLLAWVLYFTGGATNPFITLLLVPLALSAAALRLVPTLTVTLLALVSYGVLMLHNVPLPDMVMGSSGFRVHLTGMAVNFMVAALLLVVFVGRMHASLVASREATRELRERALRDEGILAIATQAADAAHRLNTPMSTLRTLLPELRVGREADGALAGDIEVMVGEVERCRDILRQMVDYGRQQLAGGARPVAVGKYLQRSADRFRLLCPAARLDVQVSAGVRQRSIAVQPGLAHALLNLLQNAFDASQRRGSDVVNLNAREQGEHLEVVIADFGGGLSPRPAAGVWRHSTKADGLGIGLALARSTVERMHGAIDAQVHATGTQVRVSLPLL